MTDGRVIGKEGILLTARDSKAVQEEIDIASEVIDLRQSILYG